MRYIQWLLSLFIFLFICVLFIQFGNSILNVILLISLVTFGIKFLIQKYTNHY
ncbi:hypothetical protein CLCHR_02250 [Clostridium chromiireducens]|uniref:Uncharacterized protein n=1 Tax=Clostridium chromiireducens TaxID=225345 RepID=A0A1V4J286_9CLOT|nr:hypothetical protein CLCHR_02250 [Clostridium chromiireducens]